MPRHNSQLLGGTLVSPVTLRILCTRPQENYAEFMVSWLSKDPPSPYPAYVPTTSARSAEAPPVPEYNKASKPHRGDGLERSGQDILMRCETATGGSIYQLSSQKWNILGIIPDTYIPNLQSLFGIERIPAHHHSPLLSLQSITKIDHQDSLVRYEIVPPVTLRNIAMHDPSGSRTGVGSRSQISRTFRCLITHAPLAARPSVCDICNTHSRDLAPEFLSLPIFVVKL